MGVLVRQRKGRTGWWVIAVHQKKRQYRRFNDPATAKQAAQEIALALARGHFHLTPASSPSLDEYVTRWLAEHVKPFRKSSTYDIYATQWRLWGKPALGSVPLAALTRNHIKELVARMTKAGKSHAYMKGTVGALSSALTRAVDEGLLAVNPCARALPRLNSAETVRVASALTKEQLSRLLAVCRERLPRYYPLVLLWARTGLRLREALALQWGDLDFERHLIAVRRTLTPKGNTYLPKSGKPRLVDLSQQLAATLTAMRPPLASASSWVFPSKKGTPLSADNFRRRVWRRLFAYAGLPYVRIHDLRHTFATLLLAEGESIAYVQQQLGHTSIRTTVDRYGHLQPGYNRGAVNKLDD